MQNIAIRIMYDGTSYHGWQMQKDDRTVQETLNYAISKVCGEKIVTVGCGRTDAGVHAEKYCVNFFSNTKVPIDKIPLAINAYLPNDISVVDAVYADDSFNAISSCLRKEYTYKIYNSQLRNPFLQNRALFYPKRIDIDTMKKAASMFVGEHDFAAVRSVGTEVKSTVRTVYYYEVEEKDALVNLRVCANGFLYNMARAMAGTVLYASDGKIKAEDIPKLLALGDRKLTGPTVPACGLYMTNIWYNGTVGLMMSK